MRSIGIADKRGPKNLAVLKKLVGDEQQWPWAIEHTETLMRHFGDIRAIDGLGDQADFSLSHGAVEQALADIGTFEGDGKPSGNKPGNGFI